MKVRSPGSCPGAICAGGGAPEKPVTMAFPGANMPDVCADAGFGIRQCRNDNRQTAERKCEGPPKRRSRTAAGPGRCYKTPAIAPEAPDQKTARDSAAALNQKVAQRRRPRPRSCAVNQS